ncbi:hypothetical protein mRhiFer1_008989 [Rhinolophus ferrumequinum]|uniref:Uncharacterized protein n=1 Tax=Rhinolophus ferrumequinum TaxID=59479 RepID=A0A7J7TEY8_RHIFE|nr:hypothetical protein mRhiFer1_008989 [Rhinolophus ferrumequinum]
MGHRFQTWAPEACAPFPSDQHPQPFGAHPRRGKEVPGCLSNDTGRQQPGAARNSGTGGAQSGETAGLGKTDLGGPGSVGEAQATGDSSATKAPVREGVLSWWLLSGRCKYTIGSEVGTALLRATGSHSASRCSVLGQPGPTSDSQGKPDARSRCSV